MPSKNTTKKYIQDGYYHIYNRGVEKRSIFQDEQDYGVFLSYLKNYLSPKNEQQLCLKLSDPQASPADKDEARKLLRLNNFSLDVSLIAYCLMPNHFHLFIRQNGPGAMDQFMNSLGTRYTMYFNRKYRRVGSLYEDVYKAVLVSGEEQFLHLSRYFHRQALKIQNEHSSYPEFLGSRKTSWVHPEEILAHFSRDGLSFSYRDFVEQGEIGGFEHLKLEADDN